MSPKLSALVKLFRCLAAGAAATVMSMVVVEAASPPRPNILFIVSDDLNASLGCYGDPLVKTPNIDRLAARGVKFERAYCTYSLCGPSRNSFLTGLYPNSTGITQNRQLFRQAIPDQPSLPQLFRQNGYYVARIGKMFHYEVPYSIGTSGHDDPASWEIQINPAGVDRLADQDAIHSLTPHEYSATPSWYASSHPDAEHTDGQIADAATWVLQHCAEQHDRPFFVAVGFFRPHTPYVAPAHPYFDWYPEADMPLGHVGDRSQVPAPALASFKAEDAAKFTDPLRRQARQGYYASISFMDAQVGRLVEAVQKLGIADHTIIVFTSDHGYHLGEHGLWLKQSLFEESTRIPLIIVPPEGARTGSTVRTPVSLLDLFPTLCGLTNVTPPANLQGQDLRPMLQDPEILGRGWALMQVARGAGAARYFGYSLRTARWRYTEWKEGAEGIELYDHDHDSEEMHNLAGNESMAGVRIELAQTLHEAIRHSFPPGGVSPPVHNENWNPSLGSRGVPKLE